MYKCICVYVLVTEEEEGDAAEVCVDVLVYECVCVYVVYVYECVCVKY
jgi:hypothetical protein